MSSPLLVLQHIACEPPASFEDELRSRGLDLVRVELDEGEPLPDWREFPAIVVMGGPMGAYDELDHARSPKQKVAGTKPAPDSTAGLAATLADGLPSPQRSTCGTTAVTRKRN